MIHSFNDGLLSACYVPDAVLDVLNVIGNKDLFLSGVFMLVEEKRLKKM